MEVEDGPRGPRALGPDPFGATMRQDDLTDLGVARPGQPARGFIDPPGRPGKAGCGHPCRHEWFDAETGSQQHCSRPQAHSTMQRTSPLRRHVFEALAVARHSHGYKSPSDAEADEATGVPA